MPRRPRIALLVESSRAYGRGLLAGIARYAELHGPWSFCYEDRGMGEPLPRWFSHWDGDGVIVRVDSRAMERAVVAKGIPTVNLRSVFQARLPLIEIDNASVADLAVEHLLERGFRQFAFCGFRGVQYSERREQAFAARLAAAGYACDVFLPSARGGRASLKAREQRGQAGQDELISWLAGLPRPIGLMACNDLRGQQVLNACRHAGIEVPEQMAVLGVDNDEIICRLCDPQLSSVVPDAERAGFEAAALLDRLMRGRRKPVKPVFVPPKGIVTRHSTDVLAIHDAEVARALHFIRGHACEGITVNDLLKHVPLTPITLRRRFIRVLGRSAKAEIIRVQMERAKQLLAETDLSQAKIAEMAGFKSSVYLSTAFKQRTGQTPSRYRARHRGPGPPFHVD